MDDLLPGWLQADGPARDFAVGLAIVVIAAAGSLAFRSVRRAVGQLFKWIWARRRLTSQLRKLDCGIQLDAVEKLLGTAARTWPGTSGCVEHVFALPEVFVQVLVDEHRRVLMYAITTRSDGYQPEIPYHPDTTRYVPPLRLGRTSFNELHDRPSGVHGWSGANRFGYAEVDYFGYPGRYQWYVFAQNQHGANTSELPNVLHATWGWFGAPEALPEFARGNGADEWLQHPDVVEYRADAKINTFAVISPEMDATMRDSDANDAWAAGVSIGPNVDPDPPHPVHRQHYVQRLRWWLIQALGGRASEQASPPDPVDTQVGAESTTPAQPLGPTASEAGSRNGVQMSDGHQKERATDRRRVFVIHGRNEPARKGMFAFLRALGLEPIEWSQAISLTGKGSPYIGEVLDRAFEEAQAIVVLQTPDDVAYLHESLTHPDDPECDPQMQPRPNVLFEAGMAMGRNAERTVIVELGKVKQFSDIHGRHVVRLDDSLQQRQALAIRLRTAGCAVNTDGTDWHSTGDLTPPVAPGGGLPLGRKLPSSRASGLPRLEARLQSHGGNRLDEIVITNHGPGDVYELSLDADPEAGLVARADDGFPVPMLPAGKSVKAMRITHSGTPPYFTLVITAKTADGTELRVDEFVSG